MDVKEMNLEQIEARMEEIKQELMGECDIKALTQEVDALEARKAELEKAESNLRKAESEVEKLEAGSSPEKEQKKAGSNKTMLIVIAVVVIAAIVAIAAFAMSGKSENEGSQSDQTTEEESDTSDEASDTSDESGDESSEDYEKTKGVKPVKIEVKKESEGDIWYTITVKNTSKVTYYGVEVAVSYLDDDDNIVGDSYPSFSNKVKPGQSVALDDYVEVDGKTKKVKLDSFQYYDSKENSYDGELDSNLKTVDLTKPGTTEY